MFYNKNKIKTKGIIVCDNCKHEFFANSVKIDEQYCFVKKQKYLVEYFTCPKCNRVYVIIIKNKEVTKMLQEIWVIQKRIIAQKDKGNVELMDKLITLASNKSNKLGEYVRRLKMTAGDNFVVEDNILLYRERNSTDTMEGEK